MNLAKVYEPDQYEPSIYALWESSGAFKPSGKGVPYGVVMPPPNANGNLHIGHALDMNLKDILARYHRLKGKDVAFIPGSDHAGFETWVVYEKELKKQGKTRFDFSREKLYSDIWDYVAARRGDMELQLRALGVGASWDDSVFTLDKKVIKVVYDTFKKMWDEGLIYRGERIVNYCTEHQTSFADIEVVHKDQHDKIWQLAYPLLDTIGEIIVATTRPETMLGDTAIAVHPEDERYKHLIGQSVLVPVIKREIPIVADDAVAMDFGTGAVKVTPAHDPLDNEIGSRHNLPAIQVIGRDGKMTREAEAYAGMSIDEARQQLLATLETEGVVRHVEEYSHSVGHCYKCGTRIQPLMMEQWFVRIEPLAAKAIEALEKDEIQFYPHTKKRELVNYLSQLRDWNISRQPAWGIPIPAFQNVDEPEDWIFDARVDQPTIEVDGKTYRREEDTLDTWFSSGQWPYIVTDYLEQGKLSKFFPSAVMETGNDLLRAWVSRMIMFSVYRTGQVPFKDVYMHGMVNDEHNQKMSKSKGNVINPMEIVGAYGSDALRLGIVANRSAAQNQAFSTASVVAGRNFCNKLWNIARYIEPHLEKSDDSSSKRILHTPKPQTIADHWVISRLETARKAIDSYLAEYRFSDASETVYHVIWDDVADWYLEASKQSLDGRMLRYVLETCLTIAHPFAPFVTEAIWTTLEGEKNLLIKSSWPKAVKFDADAAEQFESIRALVSEVRFVCSELPGGKQALVYDSDELVDQHSDLIARLARLRAVQKVDKPKGLRLAVPNRHTWIRLDEKTLYEHQEKLEKRLVETRARIESLEQRLANKTYVDKAPEALVAETKSQLDDQKSLEDRLVAELSIDS